MSDKEARKYFENMPYGDDAKSSEIHGKESQQVINQMVSGLVKKYDEYMATGDKDTAGSYSGAVKSIAKSLDNLKEIKKQFATFYGGGTGGKKLFSNWTNTQQFDVPFFLEKGRISFDEELQPVLSVTAPDGKNEVTKRVSDITQDWVIRGTEEADYMKMQQDAVKQSNTMGQALDFDVDWAVDNILSNQDAWKSFASDKIGGRYFLQDYVMENQDKIQSGEISDEMLHPTSFDPAFDTRLHKYYSDRIRNAFNPNLVQENLDKEAKKLMKRLDEKA
tara:strand:- start:143 stop:973 length:831 start_codon:yes stop_codon:yes gene_type:complete